jgi:hypothetical protein
MKLQKGERMGTLNMGKGTRESLERNQEVTHKCFSSRPARCDEALFPVCP